jgi:hypothetical protein
MRFILSTSLAILFAIGFMGGADNALAACGTGPNCTGDFVCVTVDGATKCLENQAESNGDCRGDSTVKCSSGQACIQNQAKEIVCAPVSKTNTLQPATDAKQNPSTPNSPTGTATGGGNNSGSGSTGLSQGLNQFRNAGSGLNTGGTLIGYIANIIRWILGLLGTVFFIIIVLQGYLYMTSSGDASKTAAATGAITNAVIGLLIIMGAFLITNFVTSGLLAAGA